MSILFVDDRQSMSARVEQRQPPLQILQALSWGGVVFNRALLGLAVLRGKANLIVRHFDIDMYEDAAWAVQTVSGAVKFIEDMLK